QGRWSGRPDREASDCRNLVSRGRAPCPCQDGCVGAMQFGIFSVGDVTPDPTTGRTPTEHERIMATVAIAEKAEEVGLDVFATGEHHNPPFIASAPTTTLAYIGAQTERIILSTATTLITTTDPVLIAENYAKLQHL